MKLRTITQEESDRLARNNLNPADFAGFDEESGDFITRAEFSKTSALAPANPFMAAVAEPVYRAGADMYRAANRLPASAAEMLFGKQAGPAASIAAQQGAINTLMQAVLEKAAAGSAASRQPGKADTVLSTTSALVSGIAPYLVNPMLGLSASAMQGAGAGSERAQTMGATPGQELANMIGRAGASAALDRIGMLGAAKTPWTREAMTKLAARGAVEGAATQGAFNVADKVTFNPQQDLTEGLPSSALLGAIAPVGLRAGSEGLARLSGAPPVMPAATAATPSRTQILGELRRLPRDQWDARIEEVNKQYPNLLGGEGPLTAEMVKAPLGNSLRDSEIVAMIELARTTGESVRGANPNEKLLVDAVVNGFIDSSNPGEARRILNEGRWAYDQIRAGVLGNAAAARQAEVNAAMIRAAAAARAGNVPNEVKAIAEGENARAASQAELEARTESAAAEVSAGRDFEADIRAAYQLPREYVFSAVDNKGKLAEARAFEKAEAARQKLVSKGIERGVTGKDKYAKDTVLGQLQEPAVRTIDDEGRPMSAEQTLLAEREKAEADKMKQAAAPQAVAEKVAQAVQTVTTGTPAGESTATGAAAAPKPAAPTTPDKVTTLNDTPATMKPTVPKVGNDADKAVDNPPKKGNGPEPQETKTPTAPESKPLVVPGGKPDTSAVRMVGGTSPNPPAAAVVEAGGAKEATPRSDITLEEYLKQQGTPPQRPTSAITTPERTALPPELQALGDEASRVNIEAMRLELAGKTAEADALRAEFAAKRAALTSALPKDKVAAPVATVESKPATPDARAAFIKEAARRRNVNDDGTVWSSGERVTPTPENIERVIADSERLGTSVSKLEADIKRLEELAKTEPNATTERVRRLGREEGLFGLSADTSIGSFKEALNSAKQRLAQTKQYHSDLRKMAEFNKPASTAEASPAKVVDADAIMRENAVKWGMNPDVDYTWVSKLKKGMMLVMPPRENGDPGNSYYLSAKRRDGSFKTPAYGDLSEDNIRGLLTRGASIYDADGNLLYAPKSAKAQPAAPAPTPKKPAAPPPPLKIKRAPAAADPVAADRAVLDKAGLTVRKKPDGTYELYNKEIDEVVRDLGGAASEAEAIGEAARLAKGPARRGGMGSKLNKNRQDEAGFVLNPGEAIEKAARAVGGAVGSTVRKIGENVRSATNQLGDYADRKNDETGKHAYRQVNKMATFGAVDGAKIANENQRIWNKLSSAERAELDERLAYEMAYKTKLPGRMSPRAQAAYDEYKQHVRELGERAAREGPMINEGGELRPLIIDEFWSPENLSPAAIKRLENLDTRQEAIDEVRAWWRQYGLSQEQIDKEIQRFDIIGKYADADLEFDALHNPMAAPLPPGWAGNKQDAFNRYAMKYAFDMARHKYIDQDPLLGPMSRKQREGLDEIGRPTARQFEAGEIGDNVDSLFRAALNSFALQLNPGRRGVREGAVTAAHRSVVQTAAHALDTIRMIPDTVADAGVKNAFKGLIDGITKYDELKARGLVKDTGNLSGDVQRIGEALKGTFVRGKLDALNEALGAQGRLSGVDIMNKFMQAMSAAAGVARAKEAIAKNDDAFFKRVGLTDWRSMTPEQVEEFVGKWVTEGSQSSMGAKDLPMTFLTQRGFGRNFVPIMRWAFGYTNQQIDRAFKPLFDSGLKPIDRVRPLAVRLVGSAAASQVGQMLVGALFGRDDRSVTNEEWEAAGKPGPLKRIAQKATELQILPAIMAAANVMLGNAQMPRNLVLEVPNKLKDQLLAMSETKRDLDAQDILTVLDATLDTLSSNWRDVSKVVAGETRDPIEQARARFEGMNKTMLSRPARNPLNLGTALNEAKTEEEVFEIGKRILATATIETPDINVAGPSEDAAFLEWLRKTDPALHAEYVKKNVAMAAGADKLYNTKKAVAETVNKLLEQKKKGLIVNEPDSVKAARGLKIDWKKGELDVK